jgi:hypothetical protein
VENLAAARGWTEQLQIPPNMSPGAYLVNATCAGPSRSLNAFYTVAPITVVAALSPTPPTAGAPQIPTTR